MIDPKDLRTLTEMASWWRQNKTKVTAPKKFRQPQMVGGGAKLKIGKADAEITAGSSGTVSVWRDDLDTTEEIEGYLDWLTDQNISAGKEVAAAWFADESKWRIIAAECEDPSEPEVFQAGNSGTAETLTTTFEKITGMTLIYTSGAAIVPTAPAA